MAKRRCISTAVYHSSEFFRLSDKAKVLYTYFMLNTDDYGFIENPELCMNLVKATQKEHNELLGAGLIIQVGDKKAEAIKHFFAQNSIPRPKETLYAEELSLLNKNARKEYEYKEKT